MEHDLDVRGLKKKHARKTEQHFIQTRNASSTDWKSTCLQSPWKCSHALEEGRPRMPALAVFISVLLRGWIGGPKSVHYKILLKRINHTAPPARFRRHAQSARPQHRAR
ncbi:MAG: hypothetical protein R3F19_34045 [Verrucomicrobiales bacterium]